MQHNEKQDYGTVRGNKKPGAAAVLYLVCIQVVHEWIKEVNILCS